MRAHCGFSRRKYKSPGIPSRAPTERPPSFSSGEVESPPYGARRLRSLALRRSSVVTTRRAERRTGATTTVTIYREISNTSASAFVIVATKLLHITLHYVTSYYTLTRLRRLFCVRFEGARGLSLVVRRRRRRRRAIPEVISPRESGTKFT